MTITEPECRAAAERKLWRTRDGQLVPVREMEDSHLRNAIAFLWRRRHQIRFADFLRTFVLVPDWMMPRGDGAQMAFDEAADDHAAAPFQDIYPPFAMLLAETERRGWGRADWEPKP